MEEALRAAPAARRLTAPLWGREEHVRELLGDRVTDVSAKRRILTVDHFGRPEDFRDYVKLLTATRRRERIPGPR